MKTNPGYESLAGVLQRALDQAHDGKGAERHANSLPFDKQPMQTIAAQVGVGFLTGQAIKKTQEGQTLPAGRDVAELLGAINYLAGAVIFLESQREPCDCGSTGELHAMTCALVPADKRKPKRDNDNRQGCGIIGGCSTINTCTARGACLRFVHHG